MTKQIEPRKPKLGRPKSTQNVARPNRIVTFVTNSELDKLEQVASDEERSMAAVVHRIIRSHFEEK
ncbi:MAG: hypothetical protein V7711_17235 [Pseudomonadales bacterium]